MPEEKISWKESNLAAIGTDLDHKIKEAAAGGEEAWQAIPKDEAGVQVWRVEQFKIVPWPTDDYGCFYTGDSYICLNSYLIEDKLYRDLFIWIGAESSQDEYGTAAYKMVEADEFLGGTPVQHREVQGHESYKFKKMFGSKLTYWQGGIESGFNHVEATVEKPNMYRIKGTEKNMSLTQVDVSKSSLNKGDSFILKASTGKVWCWHGGNVSKCWRSSKNDRLCDSDFSLMIRPFCPLQQANPDEKARAASLAEKMCTQGTTVVLDQGEDDDADFWGYLGEGEIGEDGEDDDEVEEFAPLLFKLPGGADAEPEQVGKGEKVHFGFASGGPKLSKDLLNESDIFILDAGWEIFLWMGKDADRSEKLGAFSKADKYCQGDLRTVDLPLSIVKSGYESNDFNSFFA